MLRIRFLCQISRSVGVHLFGIFLLRISVNWSFLRYLLLFWDLLMRRLRAWGFWVPMHRASGEFPLRTSWLFCSLIWGVAFEGWLELSIKLRCDLFIILEALRRKYPLWSLSVILTLEDIRYILWLLFNPWQLNRWLTLLLLSFN